MEIGGEFWIEKSQNTIGTNMFQWLSKFGEPIFTTTGRGALTLILKTINTKNKTVCLPAYICQSVIDPFRSSGYECTFYDIDNFEATVMNSNQIFGVFLYMGYFGFPTNSKVNSYLDRIKSNGTIIIEDVSHSLFSDFALMNKNDYCFGSIRKWLGIPSGGFAVSKLVKMNVEFKENQNFAEIRVDAMNKKLNYLNSEKNNRTKEYLSLFSKAENLIEQDIEPYMIDDFSLNIIKHFDVNLMIKRRQRNYSFLFRELSQCNGIRIIFPELSDEICPLFFVIEVENREILRKKLISEEIYCPTHWPIPSQIDLDLFPVSKKRYLEGMSIPCDQRYSLSDMSRIVETIKRITQ